MDLLELLRGAEGKTLEFKRELSSPEAALRTLVAFANTAGGVLLIGVEDRTRRVRGVADPLELEERLASLISDGISPRLVPEIQILPWRRKHLLAVRVHPSWGTPHYLSQLGAENGVLIRVGSTNRRADSALIGELRRFARNESFDAQPAPELDSEAIDFRAAVEFFAPVRKLRRQDLRTLRITTLYQGREVPTLGGLLLFGRDRLERFPDAWIQAGRFEGIGRRRILDATEIRSLPIQAIEDAITFVRKHTAREAVIGDLRRAELWTVPPTALRELIVNAVVHADYAQAGAPIRVALFDDRLEIENPGLLLFGLTVEDIRKGISKLRNRVLARVFLELGLIEQWGTGIQRVIGACREAGLPEPAFEEIGTHFRVTLFLRRDAAAVLHEKDRAILDALRAADGLSTSQISRQIRLSPRATRTRLLSLLDRGLLVEVATSPKDPKRRYYLPQAIPTG